jgi:succinate dehydrogenase/fumarate reductase flavoprotein subunit
MLILYLNHDIIKLLNNLTLENFIMPNPSINKDDELKNGDEKSQQEARTALYQIDVLVANAIQDAYAQEALAERAKKMIIENEHLVLWFESKKAQSDADRSYAQHLSSQAVQANLDNKIAQSDSDYTDALILARIQEDKLSGRMEALKVQAEEDATVAVALHIQLNP